MQDKTNSNFPQEENKIEDIESDDKFWINILNTVSLFSAIVSSVIIN